MTLVVRVVDMQENFIVSQLHQSIYHKPGEGFAS